MPKLHLARSLFVVIVALSFFVTSVSPQRKRGRAQAGKPTITATPVARIEAVDANEPRIWVQIYGARVFRVYGDTRDPEVIYATTPIGLYKSTDKGFRWRFVFAPPFPDPSVSSRFDPGPATSLIFSQSKNAPNVMFLGSNWGGDRYPAIWKSENGGQDWYDSSAGVIGADAYNNRFISHILISSDDPSVVHIVFDSGRGAPIYKTLNGGKSWGIVSLADLPTEPPQTLVFRRNADVFKGYDLSEDGGKTWRNIPIPEGDVMEYIAFSPKSDQIIFTGTQKGIYRSENRGKSWSKIFDTGARSLLFLGPDTIYATANNGVWKSSNGGNSWHRANFTLPMPITHFPNGVNFDRLCWADDASEVIYVGGRGGYWTTDNGGFNWKWNPIGNYNAQVLNMKVTSDGTIFLVTYEQGTFSYDKLLIRITPQGKRDNLGSFDSEKIPDGWPESLVGISNADSRVIYRGTRITEDSAFSWRQMNVIFEARHSKIIVSPVSPKIAYVLVWGDSGGVLATTDGGNTWKRLSMSFIPVDFVPDPKEAMTVYTINLKKLYRSRNGGENWDAIVDLTPLGELVDVYPPDGMDLAVPLSQFAVNPLVTSTFYLNSRKGFWESRNSGRSWHLYDRGLNRDGVERFVVSGTKVLAQGSNGIYRLSDDNLSWAVERWNQYEREP